jgi:hypothetical protein
MGSSGARAKFSSNPRAKFSLKWRVKVGPGPSVSSSDAVKDPGARLGQPGGSTPPRSAAQPSLPLIFNLFREQLGRVLSPPLLYL